MSARKRNYYQVLGVESGVTSGEIKRAYRRLAKEQHPDATEGHLESDEKKAATEEMMRINEAYATLSDSTKRAEYDIKIGIKQTIYVKPVFTSLDEDREREKFLRATFHPNRSAIVRVLNTYQKELRELSADPYDDELMEAFQLYVDDLHEVLRKAADAFGQNSIPRSMEAAVQMMKYAIAQAADGLEELRYFCRNYDYTHLTLAENLFRIAHDLMKQSLALTKNL
jgi:molecular chaperone DnaJ